jgi:hypothetical protein
LQDSVFAVARDTAKQFHFVNGMSAECEAALSGLKQTIIHRLGGATESRQMSSKILVQDVFVVKAMMLDPRFNTFCFVNTAIEKASSAFEQSENSVISHARGL